MKPEIAKHPADSWRVSAVSVSQTVTTGSGKADRLTPLRLAAMSGHMRHDLVTARRAALIDLLSDGAPHTRQEIWETIETQLGQPCWGKRREEVLWRDLRALRSGGLRIAYSRRPGAEGYYLQFPPLAQPDSGWMEPVDWLRVAAVRQMSVPAKNRQAFAAADFALRQKRLILAEEHPEWDAARVENVARRLVYGRHQITP